MTGGLVVVLGETGPNFGAGMSAGVAYVLWIYMASFRNAVMANWWIFNGWQILQLLPCLWDLLFLK